MPSSLATRLVVTPVAVFRIATCAPGIKAPLLSVTLPEIVPPETWALTAKGISKMTRSPKMWLNLQKFTDGMVIHLSVAEFKNLFLAADNENLRTEYCDDYLFQ